MDSRSLLIVGNGDVQELRKQCRFEIIVGCRRLRSENRPDIREADLLECGGGEAGLDATTCSLLTGFSIQKLPF